jgi:hypothetical protein
MTRAEWERLKAREGKIVEIDLERTPCGGLEESASVIAGLAAECPPTESKCGGTTRRTSRHRSATSTRSSRLSPGLFGEGTQRAP